MDGLRVFLSFVLGALEGLVRSVFGFGSAEDRESAERIGSGLENAVGVLVRAEEARRYVATTTILKRFTAATPTLLFHVLFFFSFQGMVI